MNRDEERVLQELDASIAENIFGCKVIRQLSRTSGKLAWAECPDGLHQDPDDQNVNDAVKNYSSDISAAWEIVEHLQKQKKLMAISQVYHALKEPYYEYLAKVEWTDQRLGYQYEFVTSRSAPHAICLAALKTLKDRK